MRRIILPLIVFIVHFFAGRVATGQTITTAAISGSPFCAGATVSVRFTYASTTAFPTTVTFTAQLSNNNGTFTTATAIGTVASNQTGSQIITATIPANTVSGTLYRIRVVGNSINGIPNTTNLVVNAVARLTSSLTPPAICTNTLFSYRALGDIQGMTFIWSRAAIAGISNLAATNVGGAIISETLINTTQAPINVIYVFRLTTTTCVSTQNVTVTVNPSAKIANKVATACSRDLFVITPVSGVPVGDFVPPNTTYSWPTPVLPAGLTGGAPGTNDNDIGGTLVNSTNGALTATYTVTATSGSGCAGATFTVKVTINPLPKITSKALSVCSGSQFILAPVSNVPVNDFVPPNTTYTWPQPTLGGGMTGGAPGINATDIRGTHVNPSNTAQTATYTATPTSSNGCSGPKFTVAVTVNPTPKISTKTIAVCNNIPFTVTPVNNVPAGDIVPAGTAYTWPKPGPIAGLTGMAAGTNAANVSGMLANTINESLSVTYSVTPKSGSCTGPSFTVIPTVNPTPKIASRTVVVCSGELFTIVPTNAPPTNIVPDNTTYSWQLPALSGNLTGTATGTNSPDVRGTLTNNTNITQTATYTVTPRVGDCVGAPFSVTVTINPKPRITAKVSVICSGDQFISAPANNVPAGDIVPAGTTYSWPVPVVTGGLTGGATGTNAADIRATLTNPTNVNQTATYTVTPKGPAALGSCVGASFTITVTVNPKAKIKDKIDTACSEAQFVIVPANNIPVGDILPAGTTYSWSSPALPAGVTGGMPGTNAPNISGNLKSSNNTAQKVIYTVTPKSGNCPGAPFTVTVLIKGLPAVPEITPLHVMALCKGSNQNFQASITTTNSTTDISKVMYEWSGDPNATLRSQSLQSGTTPKGKNAIFLFPNEGAAKVFAKVTVLEDNGCSSIGSKDVTLGTANASQNIITAYAGNLVFLNNQVDSYQWGFDTKDLLPNVFVPTPAMPFVTTQNIHLPVTDSLTKYIWVITKSGDCFTKTYFNKCLTCRPGITLPTTVSQKEPIKIYPNPVSDEVIIGWQYSSTADATVIKIIDITGKTVLVKNVAGGTANPGKLNINMAGLARGVYIVNVMINNKSSATGKLVKE